MAFADNETCAKRVIGWAEVHYLRSNFRLSRWATISQSWAERRMEISDRKSAGRRSKKKPLFSLNRSVKSKQEIKQVISSLVILNEFVRSFYSLEDSSSRRRKVATLFRGRKEEEEEYMRTKWFESRIETRSTDLLLLLLLLPFSKHCNSSAIVLTLGHLL